MPMRVKILARQAGPEFHAEVGEERTVHAALGESLLQARHAELIAASWPQPALTKPKTPIPAAKSRPRARKR